MPDSILLARTRQYNDVLDIALQQKQSRLMDKVMTGRYTGESASVVDTLESVELDRVSSVDQDIIPASQDYLRRWIAPDRFAKYFRRDTFAAVESAINPTSALTQTLVSAANRAKDDAILAAMFGDALTGTTGTTTTTWASEGSAQVVAVDVGSTGATGLNVEKLKAARKILLANEIDLDTTPVYIGYNATADSQLLQEAQVISKEYAEKAVLKDGKIEYFMGFWFVHTERLLKDSNQYRRIPVWTKNAIHFGTWINPTVSIERINTKVGRPYQVGLEAMFNATRTEPKGIVEIKISEA